MNLTDIRRLFDYTEWANELALEAAAKLSNEHLCHDFGISHKSIFGTLLHTAGADWIWWERWNGRSPTGAITIHRLHRLWHTPISDNC